jgi:cytochrome c oxidase cbb3-type subunit 3
MTENNYDVPIEGHDYDGIEELNNPLPKWWLATFYGTIVFAMIYYGYFQLGPGASSEETLARRMEKVTEAQAAATAALSAGDEDYDVSAMLADEAVLAVGKARYMETCLACHGENGEGSVGPNLTDDYWIYSRGGMPGILASIRSGFPDKGMPPWGPIIPAEEHAPVAVYVISLRGTDPPNAKAPDGQFIPPTRE